MNNESITLVVSDVFGTFTSMDNNTREETLKKFYENLNNIKNYNNSDYLFFSLITSEDKEFLAGVNDFNSPDFIVGKNFCDTKDARPVIISTYVNFLKRKYNIDEVWYFDDNKLNAMIHEQLFSKLQNGIKAVTICPTNGLDDVNVQIERILDRRDIETNGKKL